MKISPTPWMPFGLLAAGLLVMVLGGCGRAETERPESWLVRVGQQELSVRQFLRLFEATAEIPPEPTRQDAQPLVTAARNLLQQTIAELIVGERAQELGVTVSEAELEAAVTRIQADYPDGVFERLLLEQAVPYPFWRRRLRQRLLMEKLTTRELGARVVLEPEEIAEYYSRHFGAPADKAPDEVEARIVAALRREKIEQLYGPWLQELKQRYPIQINRERWQELLAAGFFL